MHERPDPPGDPRVPRRAHGPLAAAGYGVLVALVFSGALFQGGVFFQRDILTYWYPHIESFVRVVGEGSWPLWNPWVTFGTPLLADPNLQLAYPLTWLNLVLPPETYFTLFVLVHCVGAGFGTWLLARRWGLGGPGAFLAGAAYAAGGAFLSSVSLFHHFASAAWLPWVLWALDRALERRTLTASLLLGTVAAGQLLAGSADLVFMTALLATGQLVAFVVSGASLDDEGAPRRPGRLADVARVVPVAGAFAFFLAAVQWWPTIAQVTSGLRLSLEERVSLYWSLHPVSLLDLVVPGLVAGLPLNPAARDLLYEGRGSLLASVYVGLPCVALSVLALARGRRPFAWVLLGGALFFLLAALGRHTPFLPMLLELPGFGMFRYPQKYMVPASLPLALLAAAGLDVFSRAGRGRAFLGVGVLAVVLAAVAGVLALRVSGAPERLGPVLAPGADLAATASGVSGQLWTAAALALVTGVLFLVRWRLARPRPALTATLLLLAVGDLAVAGRPVNVLAPLELVRHRPPLLEQVDFGDGSPRFHVMSYGQDWLREQRERASTGGPPEWEAALGTLDRLRPPTGARWGTSGSFDGSFTGMAPPALALLSVTVQRTRDSEEMVRLLRVGSVDHVVALEDLDLPGLTEVGRFDSVFAEPVRLLRVEGTAARVAVVDGVRLASGAGIVGALLDPGFDPGREVVLTGGGPSRRPDPAFRGEARVTGRRAGRLTLETTASAPGILVVAESFDRGWRATVDGAPVKVLAANLLFLGVPVPPGPHRVELVYRPPAAFWGASATALAILFGLTAWEISRRRARASRTG